MGGTEWRQGDGELEYEGVGSNWREVRVKIRGPGFRKELLGKKPISDI